MWLCLVIYLIMLVYPNNHNEINNQGHVKLKKWNSHLFLLKISLNPSIYRMDASNLTLVNILGTVVRSRL